MSQDTLENQFEALPIPRKELPEDVNGRYRVYKEAGNYVIVHAASALEALQASGLKRAYRIQRDTMYMSNVIKLDAMVRQVEEIEIPAVLPAPGTEAAPGEALAASDIDKLLQESS